MGAKGHVQVIVPHMTESYASQRDPPEADVPYCTLKSFPSTIEHTIQWARDKFANLFELKPADFNKFWEEIGSVDAAAAACRAGGIDKRVSRVAQTIKLASTRPVDWNGCVSFARSKFEKYFNHKAKNLLLAFPVGTVRVFNRNLHSRMPLVHACALEASKRVTNGIPFGRPPFPYQLPVHTAIFVQTLKAPR
jgi:ubiquitin-activating enzyme E1-like protein 2